MKYFIRILLLWLLLKCSLQLFGQREKYEKIDGVHFEKHFDTINPQRYTNDNEVYKGGYVFHFSVNYIDSNNRQKYYTHIGNGKWDFVSKDETDFFVVEYKMEIMPDLDIYKDKKYEYKQSVIHYTFWQADGRQQPISEKTGLVENKKNIWLHPPRTDLTEILELNPFPYICFPLKKGKRWKWNLKIGAFWGDERWITWEGLITNKCKYKVIDICIIETELGMLQCFKTRSVAKSKLGKTYLTSYFNSKYGFVRYEYVNIDKSKIVINLNKITIKER